MRIARHKGIALAAALAVIGAIGVLGFALYGRLSGPSVPAIARERLQAAASQRPVDKTDQLIWDYQERIRQSPGDIQAYAVLGAAYLQKVRDTGDPAYY